MLVSRREALAGAAGCAAGLMMPLPSVSPGEQMLKQILKPIGGVVVRGRLIEAILLGYQPRGRTDHLASVDVYDFETWPDRRSLIDAALSEIGEHPRGWRSSGTMLLNVASALRGRISDHEISINPAIVSPPSDRRTLLGCYWYVA